MKNHSEAGIPDFADPRALLVWLSEGRERLRALEASPELESAITSVTYEPLEAPSLSLVGRYGDARFRKFVAATFLADLASYPLPAHQVGFERLLYVMHVFPQGFRLWGATLPDGVWLPVGYTGFYPIAETSFEILEQRSALVRDRMVVPLPAGEPSGSFFYLFNFSIVPQLRGTRAARRLVKTYAADIEHIEDETAPRRGLAAITVSADGARVAGRFGMKKTGAIVVEGHEEHVFTCRSPHA